MGRCGGVGKKIEKEEEEPAVGGRLGSKKPVVSEILSALLMIVFQGRTVHAVFYSPLPFFLSPFLLFFDNLVIVQFWLPLVRKEN
jgi:hypothetical protein